MFIKSNELHKYTSRNNTSIPKQHFYPYLLLSCVNLRRGRLVDQVQQSPEVDVALTGQGHLTSPARGVPIRAGAGNLQVLQASLGQLLVPHAPVPCHSAARNAALVHSLGAHASQLPEVGLHSHLLRRAGHVDGDVVLHLVELQPLEKEVVDELHRLVDGEAQHLVLKLVLHRLGAGTGVANDGHPSVEGELLHHALEIVGLGVRGGPVSPAVEHHAAAHAVDVLRHDHVVVRLLQDGDHLLVHRLGHRVPPGRSHHPRHARGDVDHRVPDVSVLRAAHAVRSVELLRAPWHVLVPHRDHVATDLVQQPGGSLQHGRAEDSVSEVDRV
mmetsp:Transcript_1351/g.3878  ORF Transcript_1351/g.3878 Transcript_1351/m.3878 type:complete len:328 (+) Transcript_1351:1564-2547(+)